MAVESGNGRGRRVSVGIVGAGFGGIGLGTRLRRAGFHDFTIFERGETAGGVWRANTYPGAGCDVPSHLYSFSFAPGYDWSRRFAPGDEIVEYLEGVVRDEGLRPHLRLGTEIESASFDEATGRWAVRTTAGEESEFDVLVTACGQLTNPAIPEIPGIEDFAGPSFHSARWDHSHDLTGERVAVIGTGASAIQFVPRIAERTKHLTIYQRSAPWIVPKNDRPYADWERRLFRAFPLRVAAARLGIWAFFELGTYMFTGNQWLVEALRAYSDRTRLKALEGRPDLIEKTTPDTEPGCKRVLISSEWWQTLRRDDVELVSGTPERITETGVVGPDGVERPADTIIWGTGFDTQDFVAPMRVEGTGGRELNEVWGTRPEAYLGMTVPGFPNLFVIYGPNTNHGSGSVLYTLECQFTYVLDAVRRLRDDAIAWIDLKPDVLARWHREMEERSATTQWMTGGDNWYVNNGVNTNNWPGPWLEYRRRTHRLNPADYRAARN
jgi:cation diffusion facilitator CzcD-associated flavoprotein CzcO